MRQENVDVAVIGAGSAGLAAYRAAKKWTSKVVLIEGGDYGTTCARVGCMPSKLLIAAAEAAHSVSEANAFGIRTSAPVVDGGAVMARVRRERDRFVGFVLDSVASIPEQDRLRGAARFVGDGHLRVGADLDLFADRIVIATGSTPAWPDHFSAAGDRLIVNDDLFEWTELPQSVAVFGPGVIGLELGQALHRLGVEVRMFGIGGHVGPLTDPAVRHAARQAFAREFPLDPDARIERIEKVGERVEIDYRVADGRLETSRVDYLIAATGRVPNVAGLDLHTTSLGLNARGIPRVDTTTLQVGDSPVFIAGDANPDRPLLHEAADEGRIAGTNAGRYPKVEPGARRSPLAIVFSDPQIAMVGLPFSALPADGYVAGQVSFADQGRSRVMLQNQGLLRVYADKRDGRLLGAEMAGPRAEHLGHLLAWAHQNRMTVADMLQMPFYHPVIEEGLRTALRDACRQLSDCLLRAA